MGWDGGGGGDSRADSLELLQYVVDNDCMDVLGGMACV